MTPHDLADDLRLALGAVAAAAEAIRPAFRSEQEVRFKGPGDPVTDTDLLADRILRERIMAARPHDAWLSEETADSPERLSAPRVWIVDPIDGTTSFVAGVPEFAVSVALAVDGEPAVGVVSNPMTGEVWHAVRGGGAWWGERRMCVSSGEAGKGATILVSPWELQRGDFAPFEGWELVPLGSTTLKMVRVADGTADAFASAGGKGEWDVAAAALIVSEAGGRSTDYAGAEMVFNRPDTTVRGVVSSNGRVHDAVLALVAGGGAPRA